MIRWACIQHSVTLDCGVIDSNKRVWHSPAMPKRSSRHESRDSTRLAVGMGRDLPTDEEVPPAVPDKSEKNPHAQALGRLGGLKGGKARAEKLSPERRSEIARAAVQARWEKRRRNV